MSLPNRQIGWGDRTNMLWNILAELNALTCDIACKSTTTTSSTSSTTTTTTTLCCTPGAIQLTIVGTGIAVTNIDIGGDSGFYEFPSPAPWATSQTGSLKAETLPGQLIVYVENANAEDVYVRAYLNCVEIQPGCQMIGGGGGLRLAIFDNVEILDHTTDCLTIVIDSNPC